MKQDFRWSNKDFETMSWHDVSIYGFTISNFNDVTGGSDLNFDIDFITAWHKKENIFYFDVVQAVTTFHDVFALKVDIDYSTLPAATTPFTIDRIDRTEHIFENGARTYDWSIHLNWPNGLIQFQATDFTQIVISEPHHQLEQALSPAKRLRHVV